MEKMTNLIAMNYVIDTFGTEVPEEVLVKLTNMRDSLVKKSATKSKASKANAELNAQIGEVIVSVLAGADEPMTVTEIGKADEGLSEYSNQKLFSQTNVLSFLIFYKYFIILFLFCQILFLFF